MKILFQGGWKKQRDPEDMKQLVDDYCVLFAKYIVEHDHQVVLTSGRAYDKLIADEVINCAEAMQKNVKKHLMYLLPERNEYVPYKGMVKKFESSKWWAGERTYMVQNVDAVVAVGGGKGTYDCVEKALLLNKPVFIPCSITCSVSKLWKNNIRDYQYMEEGDAEFLDDLNIEPAEFFENMFKIIEAFEENRYPKRIFIVHGRDHDFKDALVEELKKLQFEPIVLQDEPSSSLTVIEKLERDIGKVGFGFVLYTPDDLGHLPNEQENYRARQNVVFEHGFLIGALGRHRTCAILKGDLEIPSDIHGMIYERIDDFAKESSKIIRVLRQVGYKI